ncbi:MAG: hypothetical protein H0T90_10105 [Gemmatimonadales bacterium]|nr:hypothetical protein [Gemmatimonadales bacterium]
MRAVSVSAALLLAGLASTAGAQTAECAAYDGNTGRVCSAAVDATRAFHPVAGLLVSGGNPVLGTANTLGGLGHFSVTARANAANVVLPAVGYDGSGGSVPASDELYAPVPVVEVAAGIYGGLPSGLLSIDFLGSAQLLPTDQIDNFAVNQDARRIGDVALGLGYGARIGILRELGPLPAVSVSIMRRDIPQITYGALADGDQYRYGIDLHATNLRVVASKQVAFLDLAGGVGWDKYTGDASIQFRNPNSSAVEPAIEFELDNSRPMAFINAGLNVAALKLIGEVGYQGGKDQNLTTDFQQLDTTKGKFFAGLGLRVGF